VADHRPRQHPQGVARQADGYQEEQDLAEGPFGDRPQGFLLVRGRPAFADRELDREDRDDQVDEPAGDEACPGQVTERL
jgi:hypothetical protein